jgi:hypothetical protein
MLMAGLRIVAVVMAIGFPLSAVAWAALALIGF